MSAQIPQDLLIDTEKEFYSVIDGAFASMIILLSAVNEGIGASFVGALKMIKLQKFLDYQYMLNQ